MAGLQVHQCIIKQNMIIYTSRQKDRNYHRSKNKLFNHTPHAHIKSSKQKLPSTQQTNNVTINLHPRAKSPSKQERNGRSPSKGSKKSKNSVFSNRDKMMTRQVAVGMGEYNTKKDIDEKRREFRSSDEKPNAITRKERLSEISKGLKLIRSRQLQKDCQYIRRKQRIPKLFQAAIDTPKHTPPRSPRYQFLPQQGQINMHSNRQTQQLDDLRQQNQFYKLIYRASLQKMKRLQRSIEKQKEEYQKTKQQFDRELKSLQYRINRNDKKVPIGHIYSYDKKDRLKIQPKIIIPETDNQASEMSRNNEFDEKERKRGKYKLPSRLSIDST